MLEQIDVAEVTVDAAGRLTVVLASSGNVDFTLIYRAAMGVSWSPEAKSLLGGPPRDWSKARWFRQIKDALAGEYGLSLRLSAQTRWVGIPDLDRLEIVMHDPKSGA